MIMRISAMQLKPHSIVVETHKWKPTHRKSEHITLLQGGESIVSQRMSSSKPKSRS